MATPRLERRHATWPPEVSLTRLTTSAWQPTRNDPFLRRGKFPGGDPRREREKAGEAAMAAAGLHKTPAKRERGWLRPWDPPMAAHPLALPGLSRYK